MHPSSNLTNRTRLLRASATGLFLITFGIAGRAFADDPTQSAIDEDAARVLATDCNKSLTSEKYDLAYDQCSRAEKIYPSREKPPALLMLLARACRGVGKFLCARDTYNRVATMDPRKSASPEAETVLQAFIDEARRERAIVAEKLGYITLSVTNIVPGLKVTVDEGVIQSAAFGVKLSVDPGKHRVLADAPGYESFVQPFDVAEKKEKTVTITLTKIVPPPLPLGRKLATWGSFGVGAAGIAVGVVFTAQWYPLNRLLSKECGAEGKHCPVPPAVLSNGEKPATANERLQTDAAIAITSFCVAGAGIAVGTILLLTAPKSGPQTTGFTIRPEVGLGSVGASGSF